MRIVHWVPTLEVGGAERHAAELASTQAEMGVDVVVATTSDQLARSLTESAVRVVLVSESLAGRSVAIGMKTRASTSLTTAEGATPAHVRWAQTFMKTAEAAALTRKVQRVLRATGPDVLHVHNGGHPGQPAALAASRSRSVPVVLTCHSFPLVVGAQAALAALFTRDVDAAVTFGPLHDAAIRPLVSCRTTVIPPIVSPLPPRVPRPTAGRVAIVMPATFNPIKNQRALVHAVASSTVLRTQSTILLCGPGDSRPVQKEIERLGLGSVITVKGPLQREEVFASADIICLPSRHEGLPRVAIEAGYASAVFVGSHVGGIPDVVTDGQNGLLVPPGDVVGLASALESVVTDSDLRSELADSALVRARRNHLPEVAAAAHLRLYCDLVGS